MTFLGGAGAAMAGLGADTPTAQRTQFYALDIYKLKNGSQPARIHDFLRTGVIPALRKVNPGPVIALESLVAPHMPQVVLISGYPTFDSIHSVESKLEADPELLKQFQKWEQGDEPPFESLENRVLQATDYSPEITMDSEPRKSPRVFELRTYHSPSWTQLQALHARFAGPEIKIFHRSGVHPVFYTSGYIGPDQPNLTYLIPFETLEAREKAWNAFGSDLEWIKVRKESIEKHGQISSVIQISLYKATPYSPVG